MTVPEAQTSLLILYICCLQTKFKTIIFYRKNCKGNTIQSQLSLTYDHLKACRNNARSERKVKILSGKSTTFSGIRVLPGSCITIKFEVESSQHRESHKLQFISETPSHKHNNPLLRPNRFSSLNSQMEGGERR